MSSSVAFLQAERNHNMKLLDPDIVGNEVKDGERQRIQRIQILRGAELSLTQKINDLKTKYEETKNSLINEFGMFKQEINIKKTALSQEISDLGRERKELMRPIEEIRKEAEQYLENTRLIADE